MTNIELKTVGPMKYYELRNIIEGKILATNVTHRSTKIHAKGATPGHS